MLTLLARVIVGILFGPVGAIFGTPMLVVVQMLTLRLHVEETLEDLGSSRVQAPL